MSFSRATARLTVASALLHLPGLAWAQDDETGEAPAEVNPLGQGASPRAVQQYQAGLEAFRKSSFDEAAHAFMAGLKLAPNSARLALSAARAWEKAGLAAQAITNYELYTDLSPMADNQAEVEAAIAALRPLAEQQKVALSVNTRPTGAMVVLDGQAEKPLGVTPVNTRVDPGEHLMLIRLKGFEPDRRTIIVSPGHPLTLAIEMTRPGADLSDSKGVDWKVPTGFGALGLGIAGTAVGVYFGVKAGQTADRVKGLEPGAKTDYDRRKSDFNSQKLLNTAGLAGGITLILAGSGLLIWHNFGGDDGPELAPAPAPSVAGAGLLWHL